MPSTIVRIVSLLMVGAWTGLLLARGRFWDPPVDCLSAPEQQPATLPDVAVIVPARNEAAILALSLPTLFEQQYPGKLRIFLADDNSTDGTAAEAAQLAADHGATAFSIVPVPPRPALWAGKVWALAAGIAAVRRSAGAPAYWLLTDADIAHCPDIVSRLVATAQSDRRDVVSLMVQLHCRSSWERLLIPAFVFFFAKLYPFAWVADDRRATAAAAGGCILISDEMLRRIGGVESIAGALIDDCSIAAAVKRAGGRLRLEMSTRVRSVRPYESLDSIWGMVARSAYTQLDESPAVLIGTIAGMLGLYLLPPLAAITGLARRDFLLAASGALAWLLMSVAYRPILKRYGQPLIAAPLLPLSAALYTLMTVDSARLHWSGRGGAWKGRIATDADHSENATLSVQEPASQSVQESASLSVQEPASLSVGEQSKMGGRP